MPATQAELVLERGVVIPKLIGDPDDFLIVAGIGNTARDIVNLCGDRVNYFALAGAMGSATMIGMGLALAQPERRVLVVTGDGDLLMSMGSLATIARVNPRNLAMICVDNERYGATGYQESHSASGTDLAAIASGAGIRCVQCVRTLGDVDGAAAAIRAGAAATFVLVKVRPVDPPFTPRSLDPTLARIRFREALLGKS